MKFGQFCNLFQSTQNIILSKKLFYSYPLKCTDFYVKAYKFTSMQSPSNIYVYDWKYCDNFTANEKSTHSYFHLLW